MKLEVPFIVGQRVTLAILVVFFLFLPLLFLGYGSIEFEDDRLNVDVYIIALDGVDARGIDNVSRVIEGVEYAINLVHKRNYTYWWSDFWRYLKS